MGTMNIPDSQNLLGNKELQTNRKPVEPYIREVSSVAVLHTKP